jgi:CheY-like chemotaxis protein
MARVLIVDDSDSMRLLVRLSLEMDASFEVVGEAANGLDGLRKSEELDPDLIVMDLSMPVMDGIEATRRIKQGRPEVGIVAFSAAGEAALVEKVIAAGAYARVDKEDLIGLLHALQELAERVPVGAATAPAPPTPLDVWTRSRAGLAAALASFGTFVRSFGGAQVVGALGIGGAAALATIMMLVTVSPGGRDPSNAIRPETVFGPAVAPRVGSIELDGDVKVDRTGDPRSGSRKDAVPVVTVEVAAVDAAPASDPPTQPSPSNGGPGAGKQRNTNGDNGNGPLGNGRDDRDSHGTPGKGPRGDHGASSDGPVDHGPSSAAKKKDHVPPGLAKKAKAKSSPGHEKNPTKVPPGHAKKDKPKKVPPGHAKKDKPKKSHPSKGKGKH